MAMPFSIPINRVQMFHFSTFLPTYAILFLSKSSWEAASPFDLVSLSLMLSDVEHFSYVYTDHFYVFSEEMSIESFYTLKKFFFPFIFISWRLITLQYCSGFCHTLTWISHGFTCIPHPNPPSRSPLPPPSPPDPSGSSQCTSPEHLSHASNLGWWSVSPLIVYMFRCCSLTTSHTRLLS